MLSSRSDQSSRLPLPVALSEFSLFLDTALGEAMLATERARLECELSHLVGYNGLQFSIARGQSLFSEDAMGHAVALGYAPAGDQANDDVLADFEHLPVANECADVLLLHHVLEFAEEPTQLLREADRVIKPGGHMVIFSYNLLSAWPFYSRYWLWRSRTRWSTLPALRQGRLHDWLMALNYDIVASSKMTSRIPVNHPVWVEKMKRVELWLDRVGLPLGMVSLTVACKRSQPVNPLFSSDWKKRLFHGRPQTVSRKTSQSVASKH